MYRFEPHPECNYWTIRKLHLEKLKEDKNELLIMEKVICRNDERTDEQKRQDSEKFQEMKNKLYLRNFYTEGNLPQWSEVAGGGELWKEKFSDINEKVQDFYNELIETGYSEFVPPKKWLNMKVKNFVRFFLDDLNWYCCKKIKKDFFNILLHYYIQKYKIDYNEIY